MLIFCPVCSLEPRLKHGRDCPQHSPRRPEDLGPSLQADYCTVTFCCHLKLGTGILLLRISIFFNFLLPSCVRKRLYWTELNRQRRLYSRLSSFCFANKFISTIFYSLEVLMLKLKFQYFDHLMQRANSLKGPCCWKNLRTGGEGGDRGWDGWTASLTQWKWVWKISRGWWRTVKPGVP